MKESEHQLLARRQRLIERLPPVGDILRGSVRTRELRCGKPTCHCASGHGHPSHYLTVSFSKGRTEQISLPSPLLEQARQGVDHYLAWWEAVEAISAINRELLRRRRGAGVAPSPRRSSRTPR